MKVGDKVPAYPGFDAAEARRHIRYNRGWIARQANSTRENSATSMARKVTAGLDADAALQADPYHHARTYLGQRGYVVFKASVREPGVDGYYVGTVLVPNKAAVIAKARSMGWRG